MQARPVGTSRLISLRRDDQDTRFPSLLDTVIAAAFSGPSGAEIVRKAREEQRQDAAAEA